MSNDNKNTTLARTAVVHIADYEQAERFSASAAETRFYGLDSKEKALMILARGTELGLPPATALCSMHLINGKPVLAARTKVAIVKARTDVCRYFRVVESTDTSATYETHRVGDPEPIRATWTMQDAERAGIAKGDNWKKYPRAMLRARAGAELADMVYEDLVLGISTEEEMGDVVAAEAPAPNVSAPKTNPADALEQRFRSATTLEEIQSVAGDVEKLRLAKNSPVRKRLLEAYDAAAERIETDLYCAQPEAWAQHLKSHENKFGVVGALLKRHEAFVAALVFEDRWAATAEVLRSMGVEDPEDFAERELAKREAA